MSSLVGVAVLGELSPLDVVAILLAFPAYILLMAGVFRLIGAERTQIVKWALSQADSQRLVDLIRAARGRPTADAKEPVDAEEPVEIEPPVDAEA